MKVSEKISRPTRGVGQGGLGLLIVDLLDEFTSWDPTTRQYGLAVLAVGLVVSFIQNLGEDKGWWPAVLRTVPAPEQAKVVDHVGDEPAYTPRHGSPDDVL